MKATRAIASTCLFVSGIAVVWAASASVGQDQPGVVRLSSGPSSPVPANTSSSGGVATYASQATASPAVQPMNYAPYFRSFNATSQEVAGGQSGFRAPPKQPFGPMINFQSNIDNGLGFEDAYHRLSAMIPYHVVPNNTVLMTDLAASVTSEGNSLYNAGLIYRNYDRARNRIFGWNVYGDWDSGTTDTDWTRVGAGFESLGDHIDFRMNGYLITGDESRLLSSDLTGDCTFGGYNVFRVRRETRENVFSGLDAEMGGPVPYLGKYGVNTYVGGYYLASDYDNDAVGVMFRGELDMTQSVKANVYYTNDETFGSNSWVNLSFTMPEYRDQRVLRKRKVQDRLADPTIRSNRIHSNVETIAVTEAVINPVTGLPFMIYSVDPNATGPGTGTFADPLGSMQALASMNSADINIIRVAPRLDNTGTNLTMVGGLDLFDNQRLISTTKTHTVIDIDGSICDLVADPMLPPGTLGPLLSDPTIMAGDSVIRLANNNTILGMRIDAANADMTDFGIGISNPLPIVDTNITMNVFSNYTDAINLEDASGTVIVEMNEFNGRAGTSSGGMVLSSTVGSTTELLIRNNMASNHSVSGIDVTAQAGATINADNPDGVSGVPGMTVPDTGVIGNTVTTSGDGIRMVAETGATINAVVEGNTSSNNSGNAFFGQSDGGTFELASMANNTFSMNLVNGAFLHYLNGGTFNSVSEDLNGDGVLDAGEDLNGNGRLDAGIVTNTFSGNAIAGLCIFGENDGTGTFDIGGDIASLGNDFIGNRSAGIAVDLRDTATGQTDVVNNLITSDLTTNANPALTIVLDFVEAGQTITDPFGNGTFNPFDVTAFGFAATDFNLVTQEILGEVIRDYHGIPTIGVDPRSPIVDGQQLAIDFVIGDLGTAPSNGASEYYTMVIGGAGANTGGALGVAFLNSARNAAGTGPNGFATGDHVASIYSNEINALGGLTPADIAPPFEPDGVHYDVASGDGTPALADALTSGNLTFTRNAMSGTISHEIGHTVSLLHLDAAGAVLPTAGANPIMGTGAIDLTNQARIGLREFAYSGTNTEAGGATQMHVAQLLGALGTRDALQPGISGDGVRIVATDSARLEPSTFINNTIERNNGEGIEIRMNDSARAQGVTIQGNSITNNSGDGVQLVANGPAAFIDADGTIGGSGLNILAGTSFTQGNVINGNNGDGITVLAQNGGTVIGNAIDNQITNNAGNGISLLVDGHGFIDFGTPALNRQITGNTITGNGGVGVLTRSNVTSTTAGVIDAYIAGNNISNNVSGGILGELFGPNNTPPAPPLLVSNNILNMTVGGPLAADANIINGNGDVGIGVAVSGNGKANVDIEGATVTGTVDGADARFNGDGFGFRRADSSLLTATVTNSTATDNVGDGLDVDVQGNDPFDPNQPMSPIVNSVTWNGNTLSNNGQDAAGLITPANGARFRVRGDAYLIADGANNVLDGNTLNGIEVTTSENAAFGDPTAGLPPGRRVVFSGTQATNNGVDGIAITATENSRALVEITSTAPPGGAGPHGGASALGNTNISGNASDGIHVVTTGGSSDILISGGTGTTLIDGNGTGGAGGNGIRWDASGNSDATVRVETTTIRNSIAGAVEGPGDPNNNDDLDVANGDGIQFNVADNTTSSLIVGGFGLGNVIQSNEDDGIAIEATGSNATGNARPIISIVGNTIGSFNNGVPAGNGGDGISLNVFGGTAVGIAPAAVDFTLPGLSPNDGVTESGPIPQLTIVNNLISQNARRGANIRLTGAGGVRDVENGNAIFDPIRITLTDNTIISNAEEGIFYRADSDMNQSRFAYLANFPDPPQTGFDRLQIPAFYDPSLPQFTNFNLGSVNGNTAYLEPYLNLRTVQNSFFTLLDNTIQNNGTGTVTGEGVVMQVGTGSYVAADVRRNAFGGNLEEDFRTESILSAGNTFTSLDNTGDQTFDVVYLDDTAQLDLQFTNNTGNQIAPNAAGATYTNADALKAIFLGPIAAANRDAFLFQVGDDDGVLGLSIDNPVNTFVSFGSTQDIDAAFSTGGYNLRATPTVFPSLDFPPPQP